VSHGGAFAGKAVTGVAVKRWFTLTMHGGSGSRAMAGPVGKQDVGSA
jgi:hypothetical protein